MNQNERAQRIIVDLIAIPRERWDRSENGGQTMFSVEGHSGDAMYFSQGLMNLESDHPDASEAIEVYRARLGSKPYAVEIWDEQECVCLLRWASEDEIEVAEYKHGPWETVSFGLPPVDEAHRPVFH